MEEVCDLALESLQPGSRQHLLILTWHCGHPSHPINRKSELFVEVGAGGGSLKEQINMALAAVEQFTDQMPTKGSGAAGDKVIHKTQGAMSGSLGSECLLLAAAAKHDLIPGRDRSATAPFARLLIHLGLALGGWLWRWGLIIG